MAELPQDPTLRPPADGRDVFHVSGLLCFDVSGAVAEIVLNQQACLAHSFLHPLQSLLKPLHVVVTLGET
ncbi:hypothetical protein KSX_53940 [Ktedonospora formicarum]|uniref:Uncharacterized protein n=1 Tax=Ktedonospora formicarum TaxID=2778364 RepID=A0A8J3MUS1_9CHLR|nr:hypothetical protein KSX_53940 [Ktedonospora formicarum]